MLELVGKKIGMSHLFKDNGVAVPLTMVQIYDNCVLDLVVNENKEFDSLLMAFEKVTHPKRLSKPLTGIFNKKISTSFQENQRISSKKRFGI